MTRLVFVTGAGGSIGQETTVALAASGVRVAGVGHGVPPSDLPLAGWINGEITAENLNNLVAEHGRPDGVIHLAGGSSVGPSLSAPVEDFARTVSTAVHLLEWVRQATPESAVVLASSAAVYGEAGDGALTEAQPRRPTSPYGFHKAMMELSAESFARSFGVRCAILRLFSVYGPRLRKQLVWEVCSRLKRGETELRLGGSGQETRDWLHIGDAAAMLIDALALADSEPVLLNGCTGAGLSVADTVGALVEGFGGTASIAFSGEVRRGDPRHLVGDPALAASRGLVSRVKPTEGLVEMARAFRAAG